MRNMKSESRSELNKEGREEKEEVKGKMGGEGSDEKGGKGK